MPALPSGVVLMWSGSVATIPPGYTLCDGTHGTPDLRNLFIIGAGGALVPGDTDPTPTHTHNFTGDGHNHSLPTGPFIKFGAFFSATSFSTAVTGTTDPHGTRPPYYALAYIMKT